MTRRLVYSMRIVRWLAAAMIFAVCQPLTRATDMPGMTPDQKKAQSIYNLQSGYKMFSSKDPSRENLLESINDPDSKGLVEVTSAIGLLALEDGAAPETTRRILDCFKKSHDGEVRAVAAMRLIELNNDAEAQKLGENVLDDGGVELMSKLLVSRVLVERGNLHGYPHLTEGLRSKIPYVKDEAVNLREYFRPHDGEVWNEKGEKVDMAEADRLAVVAASQARGLNPSDCERDRAASIDTSDCAQDH